MPTMATANGLSRSLEPCVPVAESNQAFSSHDPMRSAICGARTLSELVNNAALHASFFPSEAGRMDATDPMLTILLEIHKAQGAHQEALDRIATSMDEFNRRMTLTEATVSEHTSQIKWLQEENRARKMADEALKREQERRDEAADKLSREKRDAIASLAIHREKAVLVVKIAIGSLVTILAILFVLIAFQFDYLVMWVAKQLQEGRLKVP